MGAGRVMTGEGRPQDYLHRTCTAPLSCAPLPPWRRTYRPGIGFRSLLLGAQPLPCSLLVALLPHGTYTHIIHTYHT